MGYLEEWKRTHGENLVEILHAGQELTIAEDNYIVVKAVYGVRQASRTTILGTNTKKYSSQEVAYTSELSKSLEEYQKDLYDKLIEDNALQKFPKIINIKVEESIFATYIETKAKTRRKGGLN